VTPHDMCTYGPHAQAKSVTQSLAIATKCLQRMHAWDLTWKNMILWVQLSAMKTKWFHDLHHLMGCIDKTYTGISKTEQQMSINVARSTSKWAFGSSIVLKIVSICGGQTWKWSPSFKVELTRVVNLTNESTKIKLVKLCSSIYCLTKMRMKIAWF